MIIPLVFQSMLMSLQGEFFKFNDFVYQKLNGLAGHSWLFDNLVSLVAFNDLIKAAAIGSCFFAAWFSTEKSADTQKTRKILLTTIIASILVLATTKSVSHSIFLPRPYVLSQKAYHLNGGDDLVEFTRTRFHAPVDDQSQSDYRAVQEGDIRSNDLESFPSDHAGFFLAISLGIFLASRRIGLIALGWTLFVVLGSKIITGQHTPLDIAGGAFVAIVWLSICQFLAHARVGNFLDKTAAWTMKHSAISSAAIFMVIFEISSTLDHVPAVLKLLAASGKRILRIG